MDKESGENELTDKEWTVIMIALEDLGCDACLFEDDCKRCCETAMDKIRNKMEDEIHG